MSSEVLKAGASLFQEAVEKDELRGAVLLVARRGMIVLHEAIGWRDKDRRLPLERDTVFQTASNTKPVVAAGVLRGAGDTRAPLIVNILGFWLIGLPTSLVLGFTLGYGPQGLWWGLVAGLTAVAGFLLARVAFKLRGEIARVEVD